ncbi:hypothetical protein, partial [Oleiphilus sp. HI0125]|uniref:hypothetical protein n=1 Tax=Oleiphilus sp. HI0125 TaxID=1822266 RepID=UPI0018D3A816
LASPTTKTLIIISDLPEGSRLSAGVDNGDGSYSLAPDDLDDLFFIPSPHSGDDVRLSVSVIEYEEISSDQDTSVNDEFTLTQEVAVDSVSIVEIGRVDTNLDIKVEAIADAPLVVTQQAEGNEDTAIDLNISTSLVDGDGSEKITSIVIADVPFGASLSAGIDNGNNTESRR